MKAAIVGAGMMAGGYDAAKKRGERGVFTHAGAYAAHPSFSLATVCEPDSKRAAAFQKRWKVPARVSSAKELARLSHDVVSVCSPDATHFAVTRTLLEARCCGAVFLEKPAASSRREIEALLSLSKKVGIPVVVNYQRRFERAHLALRERAKRGAPLAVNAYYIKGLRHVGTTMIDTLTFLFGRPSAALSYDSVSNKAVGEKSVEFVLYFDGFNATVKTADRRDGGYAYHVFEIDALFGDGRVAIMDNSRAIRASRPGAYAYSGVKTLVEGRPERTGYDEAMKASVDYLTRLLKGARHDDNRLEDSLNDALVLEAVEASLDKDRRIPIPERSWKR